MLYDLIQAATVVAGFKEPPLASRRQEIALKFVGRGPAFRSLGCKISALVHIKHTLGWFEYTLLQVPKTHTGL